MIGARSPVLTGRRVLVVEDEYFIAEDLTRQLEERGVEVIGPISQVSEALAAVSADRSIDAAVLDIHLHGEMVYPLAETLRSRDIPFIFATGYGAGSLPSAFADVPRLQKPFALADLIRLLPTLVR